MAGVVGITVVVTVVAVFGILFGIVALQDASHQEQVVRETMEMEKITEQSSKQKPRCDPSYPDVCITHSPPDLDCLEIKFVNFKVLSPDPHRFDGDNDGIGCESGSAQSSTPVQRQLETLSLKNCSGSARCFTGSVTQIIDGDTIKVDGESIRFALTSTSEFNEYREQEARRYLQIICPVGSLALVDEDDGQTQGSYDRIIGVIYCNGLNLNEEILDAGLGYFSSGFCSKSEFSTYEWAQKHGC